MGNKKSVETVKADSFEQSMLTDDSFSIVNFHSPSGFGGACLVIGVLLLAVAGYALAKWRQRKKVAARRQSTSLDIVKTS